MVVAAMYVASRRRRCWKPCFHTRGYQGTPAAPYGLQVGVRHSGTACFFMTDEAIDQMRRSDGWKAGRALGLQDQIVQTWVSRVRQSDRVSDITVSIRCLTPVPARYL